MPFGVQDWKIGSAEFAPLLVAEVPSASNTWLLVVSFTLMNFVILLSSLDDTKVAKGDTVFKAAI